MYGKIFNSFKSIKRSGSRSWLTIIGVAIGVFSVVVISGIGVVGSNQINAAMETMGINSAIVEASEAALTKDDLKIFEALDGVDSAMPLTASVSRSKILGESLNCYAWGIDKNAKDIISIEAIHGRLIENQDVDNNLRVCVIDEVLAAKSYGRSNIVGKHIKLFFSGGYYDFEIVGIARSGISGLQNIMAGIIPDFVYLPYSTMQDITGKNTLDKIALLLNAENSDNNLTDSLSKKINAIKKTSNGLTVNNLQAQKKQLSGILKIITTVLSLIAGISLLVSGISVMTAMLVSVSERKKEIGIKKSIGAKSSQIMKEFLIESIFLTAIGCIIGIALGILCCFVGCSIIGTSFCAPIDSAVLSFIFCVLIGAVFGAYPAAKAAGMNPIDALR